MEKMGIRDESADPNQGPKMPEIESSVTVLLNRATEGDQRAQTKLFRVVESELRKIARKYMRDERPDHTLQPTLLANDAFLRLIGSDVDVDWQDRAHFYRTAARAMRRMLVDHQRQRQAAKRGGDVQRMPVEMHDLGQETKSVDLLALDEALSKLAQIDPRQSEIVELHHFGGCSLQETADLLELSTSTVKREWAAAKAWLHMVLSGE